MKPVHLTVHWEMRSIGGKYKLSCPKYVRATRAPARRSFGMTVPLMTRFAIDRDNERPALQSFRRAAARSIVKRSIAAAVMLGIGAMLGSCAGATSEDGFSAYVADHWPHWAGGLPERRAAAARLSGLQPIHRPRASRSGCAAAGKHRQCDRRSRNAGFPDRAVGTRRGCRTGQRRRRAQRTGTAAIGDGGFECGAGWAVLEHDPEKRPPVFGKDRAQTEHASRHAGAQQIVEMHDADRALRFHDDERRNFR